MKFVYPAIDHVFDTSITSVNTLVIENAALFLGLLTDLYYQLQGNEGKAVVSENNSPLRTDKNLELLQQFVPFDLNKKALLNRLLAAMEKSAVREDHYVATMELLSGIEAYLRELSFDLACDVDLGSLSITSILKAAGIIFRGDDLCLAAQVIDYMELVTEFEQNKLFITVNLRSFCPDEDVQKMIDTVLRRGYNMIMIESSSHPLLPNEKRYIVDRDLCEIC